MRDVDKFIKQFSIWAENESNILAIGLVGSYARGTAKRDSDIDLMIIVKDPQVYITDNDWISKFGEVKKIKDETWGQVKTKRVFYESDLEIEFNFDKRSWVNPRDLGTQRAVKDGMKVLIDKENILSDLQSQLKLK